MVQQQGFVDVSGFLWQPRQSDLCCLCYAMASFYVSRLHLQAWPACLTQGLLQLVCSIWQLGAGLCCSKHLQHTCMPFCRALQAALEAGA